MIAFPCTCGHRFELPDERSGGLEQCPACSRLNDVPTLSDLTNLHDDGTFQIDDPIERQDKITIGHLAEAFAPGTTDQYGNERDYRRVAIQPLAIAVDPNTPHRVAPRYDPVTGELIRPLEVSQDVVLEALPVEEDGTLADVAAAASASATRTKGAFNTARPRSLRYSTDARQVRVNPASALVELLMPANVTVIFIIFLATYAAGMFGQLLAVGSQYVHFYLQVLNVPLWLLMAHYGCVIEDLGPDAMDELPRPLRFGELSNDILNPLLHVLLAGVLSFFPLVILLSPKLLIPNAAREVAALLAGLVGVIVFPAVLLTCVSGVTYLNLRPDRVLAVMVAAAGEYILAVGALLVAALLTAAAFAIPVVAPQSPWFKIVIQLHQPYVMVPVSLVAVYVTHYFCWLLGLIYRQHHSEFPWVLQHHVRVARPMTTRST